MYCNTIVELLADVSNQGRNPGAEVFQANMSVLEWLSTLSELS